VRPRNAELGLLILSFVIALGTYALVDLSRSTAIDPGIVGFAVPFALLVAAGHIAVRRLAPAADPLLYAIAVLLSGFGYGVIRRMDPDLAAVQLGWIAVGVGAFLLTLFVVRDHRKLEQFRYSFMLLGIGLLLLPLTPIGTDLGRAARLWVQVGPLSFQPAEAAKVVLAVFLAGYLAQKRELMTLAVARIGPLGIPAPRHFGPLLLAWGVSLAIMFYQRDLGSSLLFFSLFVISVYAATARGAYAVVGMSLFGAGVWFAYDRFAHVRARISDWIDPWSTFEGTGRQIAQSAFALGTGGLSGVGLGLGNPQLIDPGLRSGTLPTDFIFAAIGEELGLLGTLAIMLLFVLIVARGLHIALRSRDQFGTLLATSLTVIIGLQAFLIMGGVSRLVPLTGITLPFVSYGGSSLVANWVLVALLIRVSDAEAVR